MPRRQKNKARVREKRHQGRGEAQGVGGAPVAVAAAAAAEEPPRAPPASPEEAGPSSPPQGGPAPGSPGPESPGLPGDQSAENPAAAAAPTAPLATRKTPLIRKAGMLVQFLLEKHSSGEPLMRAALLKIIGRKYREHFPEIFRLTCQRMELVFGLELREVNARGQSYTLVSKMALPGEGTLGGGSKGLPKTGLLMALLGVIFMKGNRASEEEVWEFLNVLGVQEGKRHPVFGEPRKLITRDLVRQGYVEYRPVPASDPLRHEFLWGPKARAETSKMQVLQVLAKINDTVPSSYPQLYEEALLEEEERAGARPQARGAAAKGARSRRRV